MSLILYHHPISTCSQKVRLMLAEKGLEYESQVVDLSRAEHLTPEYLAINPNGVVPTLIHDGSSIRDSSVICEYLDEVFDKVSLTPTDPVERANMRAWMRYLEEVPTVAIRAPSYNMLFARRLTSLPPDEFEALTEKMPLRKHFLREMKGQGFSENKVSESIERLDSCLSRAEASLADKPFLLGENLTIADFVLLPTIVRMFDLGMAEKWSERPGVSRWFDAMRSRPSFSEAYRFAGSRAIPLDTLAGAARETLDEGVNREGGPLRT
jgi:glutathione S-transferase